MQTEETPQQPPPQANRPDDVPALPAPPEKEAVARPPAEKPRASGNTAWRILVAIFKFGLFLVALVVLVAALYFSWYRIYAQYLLPAQNNIARVTVLEQNQQASQGQLLTLQAQLPTLAGSQANQAAALTALAPRVATLESALDGQTQAQATAQAGQAAALTALAPRVAALEGALKKHTQVLAELQSTQAILQSGDAGRRAELERQVSLLKSMELLSRARLFLYQSNFGLAKQDLQTARDLLAGIASAPDPALHQSLGEVVQRLDLALSRLPDFPVAASDDLDIAWQILLGGPLPPTATPTAPAANELTPTPTP